MFRGVKAVQPEVCPMNRRVISIVMNLPKIRSLSPQVGWSERLATQGESKGSFL